MNPNMPIVHIDGVAYVDCPHTMYKMPNGAVYTQMIRRMDHRCEFYGETW